MKTPPKQRNTTMIVIGIVLGLFLLCSCVCGGFFLLGAGSLAGTVMSAPKTYYEECQTLSDVKDCQECCKSHGHNGHMAGEMLNEFGNTCGCI